MTRALLAAFLAAPLAFASPASAAQPRTWNFDQIHIGQSQSAGRNGAGVTVAVIDTWIDRTHPDFGGRVLTGADCATGGACKPGNVAPDKCEAHGTHVAGTVASATYGVAPAARILPIRVLKWSNNECAGTSNDLARAIRYASGHGAKVVNVSAGAAVPLGQRDTTLDSAVADAASAGILVVFAAGNQNLPVADSYGGNALIVAATKRGGGLASYSQHGQGVDLAAPGGDTSSNACNLTDCVISTWSDGTHHQYAALAGTSMAAPHVAGVAALLFAQRSRTRDDVIKRLRDTAHPLSGAGDGVIDASAALGVSATAPSAKPAPSSPVVKVTPRPKPAARVTATPTPSPSRKPTPTPVPTPSPVVITIAPTPSEPPVATAKAARETRAVPIGLAAMLLVVVGAGSARQLYRVT
jgi:subtilisin family serine protease